MVTVGGDRCSGPCCGIVSQHFCLSDRHMAHGGPHSAACQSCLGKAGTGEAGGSGSGKGWGGAGSRATRARETPSILRHRATGTRFLSFESPGWWQFVTAATDTGSHTTWCTHPDPGVKPVKFPTAERPGENLNTVAAQAEQSCGLESDGGGGSPVHPEKTSRAGAAHAGHTGGRPSGLGTETGAEAAVVLGPDAPRPLDHALCPVRPIRHT